MFISLFLELLIGGIIVLFLYSKSVKNRPPIFGIYRQNDKFYYLKLCFMYFILKIRKMKWKVNVTDLEKPQPLFDNIHASDSVYFNGLSRDKRSVFGLGMARRTKGRINGLFALRIPEFNEQILVSPKFPDTSLNQTENDVGFSAEEIQVIVNKPMRSWQLKYDGLMKLENTPNKCYNVTMDVEWTTNLPAFNYAVELNPLTLSRAIAREPWNRQYFTILREFEIYQKHTHYEQYGSINGTVKIDDKNYAVNVNCMRHHSFGLMRDWKNFHRYVMHFINLENGDKISVGIISIPFIYSSIEVGFITIASTGQNYPIKSCNLKLYQHGEQGEPPKDYAFSFSAGMRQYVVQVKATSMLEFFVGENSECRMVEIYSDFSVNGVSGWGVAEWQYRHISG